jgi:hypothetical protein
MFARQIRVDSLFSFSQKFFPLTPDQARTQGVIGKYVMQAGDPFSSMKGKHKHRESDFSHPQCLPISGAYILL